MVFCQPVAAIAEPLGSLRQVQSIAQSMPGGQPFRNWGLVENAELELGCDFLSIIIPGAGRLAVAAGLPL
jgi:hypothetical protein